MAEASGRWVLIASVLGSGLAGIDATVVNVLLPALGEGFDAGFADLQWTINGYTLTLAALIRMGGSLGAARRRSRRDSRLPYDPDRPVVLGEVVKGRAPADMPEHLRDGFDRANRSR